MQRNCRRDSTELGHGRDASYSSLGSLHQLSKTIKLDREVGVLVDW